MAAGKPVYQGRIERTLQNLAKPLYSNYRWEGDSIDGFADSIEGALYLLNRLPVDKGISWVNDEMSNNVVYADEPLETASLWGTMKLQANGVRTTLIHALMHTRGVIARPWRKGMMLGVCEASNGVVVVIKADADWSGRLVFDIPRHREYMGFRHDWPRMNTMPEWFIVELDRLYNVKEFSKKSAQEYSGKQLHEGLNVELKAGEEKVILVE